MDLPGILRRIEARATELGATPNAIGAKVGKPWLVPNIKKAIKQGRTAVALATLTDLSGPLQVPVEWILNGDKDPPHVESDAIANPTEDLRSEDVAHSIEGPRSRMVRVKGYVGAGDAAHFYKVSDEAFEEVPAPDGATDQTVAVEIRGTSWGRFMHTWLVFYDDVRSPVTEDLLGQPCVVGLSDDRILIKVIRRDGKGGYKLISNDPTEPDIENAEIEWAAKVTSMRPR